MEHDLNTDAATAAESKPPESAPIPIAGEDGISIVGIIHAFAKGKVMVLGVTLVAFAIGVVAAFGFYFVTRSDSGRAEAILTYNFKGIERGVDPKGKTMDVNQIKSPYVIDLALQDSGFYEDGITVEDVRTNVAIEGILPEDAVQRMLVIRNIAEKEPSRLEDLLDKEHYPAQYYVRLKRAGNLESLNKTQMTELLDRLLRAYTEYFIEEYSDRYILDSITEDFDPSKYDYPEVVRILNNQINNMVSYCDIKKNASPDFRSPTTQMTFGDIISNLELIKSVDVSRISALVHMMKMSRDPERLALVYEYSIRQMEMDQKVAQQSSASSKAAADSYQKDTALVVGVTGESTSVTQGSNVYDSLLNQSISQSDRANRLTQDIAFYKQLLAELGEGERGGRPQDFEYVEGAIPDIQESLRKWVRLANETVDDYFILEEFKQATKVVIPAHYQGALQEHKMTFLLIIAGLTFAGFFFGFLASIWKEAFPKQ